MSYTITGIQPNGLRTETRRSVASAIVLAMRWDAEGLARVEIAATGGKAEPFAVAQVRHGDEGRRKALKN